MIPLSDFNYDLPDELIAQYPTAKRSASRLLDLNRETGQCVHRHFYDLPDLLSSGDLLVFNNSRVIPARLYGQKETGGKVEILIERILDEQRVLAQIRSSHAPKPHSILILTPEVRLEVLGRQDNLFELRFLMDEPIIDLLEKIGQIPLPPYIDRMPEHLDQARYQTVYAKDNGSVAAPTAGLHFDESLLSALKNKGIRMTEVTLHVGAGTFQPVKVDDITQHKIHAEWITVNETACEAIRQTKQANKRVVAVGTTTVRSLETAALSGQLQPYWGDTKLFIYPPFSFKVVDAIITNFHLPQSTLLMLISTFAGRDNVLRAYYSAIEEKYRFFSYGDAMFIR